MRTKQNTAVIDVGSNSVRYLGNGGKRLVTTRLAQGLNETGRLAKGPVERSLAAISGFARLAREESRAPFAYATSAVRDAENGPAFARRVEMETGVPVRILTGEEEAAFALLGAGYHATEPLGGLVDIGGGSCQLISEGFALSFPMGCVRAKELCAAAGAGSYAAMKEAVFARCRALFRFPRIAMRHCAGAGGTITTLGALSLGLASYDPAAVANAALTPNGVNGLAQALFLEGEARQNRPLLRERHDVIVPGALVLLFVMLGMGIEKMAVSDADGMEGYLIYLTDNGAERPA